MKNISRSALVQYLNRRIGSEDIKDYALNGLQVEGAERIERVALAVDASLSVFRKARALRCQMVITHHGLIWGGLASIVGIHKTKIEYLLKHEINLYSSHLPLDRHPTLGNNICIAKKLGLRHIKEFGLYDGVTIGYQGELAVRMSRAQLQKKLHSLLGGQVLVLPFGPDKIKSVGIVSGAASDLLHDAAALGLDCFCTGESKHQDHHGALEEGLNVMYLGHYHSETLGVQAVGKDLTKKFGLKTIFIHEPTLV